MASVSRRSGEHFMVSFFLIVAPAVLWFTHTKGVEPKLMLLAHTSHGCHLRFLGFFFTVFRLPLARAAVARALLLFLRWLL